MRFAYADPPYLGCGRLYRQHHPDAMDWNEPETHQRLIERLCDEWPDGWALSLHVPSLKALLAMCPDDVRIGAACKNFTQIRRNTTVQWMWEPVIWRGGRRGSVDPISRDWMLWNTAPRSGAKDGIIGGKPRDFSRWVFSLLNAQKDDTLDDLFPGTGAVTAAWQEFIGQQRTAAMPLFAASAEGAG